MEAIVEETLTDKICNRLRDEIIGGTISANQRLTVKEICLRYGVNTMPVREAFNILIGERFLRNDAYKGVTVLGLDLEYLKQIYEIQCAFEVYMMKKCFSAGYSQKLCDELKNINRRIKDLIPCDENQMTRIDLNFDFHIKLYEYCSGSLMYEQYCKNYGFIKIARKYYNVTSARFTASAEEHDEIISSIENNDMEAAVTAVIKHTQKACDNCVKTIEIN